MSQGTGTVTLRNDTDIIIRGFRDRRAASGVYLNAATTKTWELRTAKSPGGTVITSGTLDYVAASNGEYVGGIDDAVALGAEGDTAWLHVILVEGGVTGDWEIPVTISRRV